MRPSAAASPSLQPSLPSTRGRRRRTGGLARGALLALLSCGVALSAWPAAAQKRTVVLPFDGRGAQGPHDDLTRTLAQFPELRLLPADDLYTMASELGIDTGRLGRDPTLLSQAAQASQVDAVVLGRIAGAQLTVEVYDGGTGNQLRRMNVKLARGRIPPKELKQVARRVALAAEGGQWMGPLPPEIPGLPPTDGGSAQLIPDPVGVPSPRPRRPTATPLPLPPAEAPLPLEPPPDDDLPGYAPPRERAPYERAPYEAPAEAPPEDWDRGDPEPLADYAPRYGQPAPAAGGTARPGLLGLAGLSLLTRSFSVDGVLLADGRPGTVSYESGLFPGLWLQGAIYPFALAGQRGALAGLGLGVSFGTGFLKSKIEEQVSSQGTTIPVERTEDTQQYQVAAGLRYRLYPFSIGAAGEARMEARVGFWRSTFALSQGTPGYRSNTTDALRAGLELELPLYASGPLRVALAGQGGYLKGSTALNEKDRYAASDAAGFEAEGGLSMEYDGVLVLSASYLYQSTRTDYAATGAEPAATGEDRYQGLLLVLGYRN